MLASENVTGNGQRTWSQKTRRKTLLITRAVERPGGQQLSREVKSYVTGDETKEHDGRKNTGRNFWTHLLEPRAVSTNQSKKVRGPLWVKGPENQHLSVARGPGLEVKAVEGSLGNGSRRTEPTGADGSRT